MPVTDASFEIIVQARFSATLPDGSTYTDAVVVPLAEFQAMTNAQIRALKTARVAAYQKAIQDARNAPRPTDAELQAARLARKAELQAQLAQAQAEIDAAG